MFSVFVHLKKYLNLFRYAKFTKHNKNEQKVDIRFYERQEKKKRMSNLNYKVQQLDTINFRNMCPRKTK